MLAALAVSILVADLPTRAPVALPAIDNRGAKISPQGLANLNELAQVALMESSLVEVVSTTVAAQALRSCPGSRCSPELAAKVGGKEALFVRILALGARCAVTVSWWSFEASTTRGAAVRDGACGEAELATSVQAAIEAVARPPAIARMPWLARDPNGCEPLDNVDELPPGYATLDTRPYSRIKWGDQELGETPLARVKLPVGCVELVATTEDGRAKKLRIHVGPNMVQRYRFDLQ